MYLQELESILRIMGDTFNNYDCKRSPTLGFLKFLNNWSSILDSVWLENVWEGQWNKLQCNSDRFVILQSILQNPCLQATEAQAHTYD